MKMRKLKALALGLLFLSGSSLWAEGPSQSNVLNALTESKSLNETLTINSSVETSVVTNDATDYAVFCDPCDVPAWKIRAGAIFLQRNTLDANVLMEDAVTTAPASNAGDFNFNSGAGLDISLIRSLGSGCNSIEARYFGVDNISASQSFVPPLFVAFPTNPPLFGFGIINIDSTYTSRLYSSEINLRREIDEDITFLVGFRWIEMYDRLNFTTDFGIGQADVIFATSNRLYGTQIGLDLRVWDPAGPFRVDSVIKAGIFGNAASNEFSVIQPVAPFSARDNESELAFLGEVNLTCTYQLTDNIAIRGGYQLLWLDRVAVASDQVTATNIFDENGINATGGAFFHGAMANIEYSW